MWYLGLRCVLASRHCGIVWFTDATSSIQSRLFLPPKEKQDDRVLDMVCGDFGGGGELEGGRVAGMVEELTFRPRTRLLVSQQNTFFFEHNVLIEV